jgi:hypothetical protein
LKFGLCKTSLLLKPGGQKTIGLSRRVKQWKLTTDGHGLTQIAPTENPFGGSKTTSLDTIAVILIRVYLCPSVVKRPFRDILVELNET